MAVTGWQHIEIICAAEDVLFCSYGHSANTFLKIGDCGSRVTVFRLALRYDPFRVRGGASSERHACRFQLWGRAASQSLASGQETENEEALAYDRSHCGAGGGVRQRS